MSYRILSLDGGGTRGIIQATILDCLSGDLKKHPRSMFELFAGTSTGGIIAIALAAGVSTKVIVDLYLNKAGDIFYENLLDRIQNVDEFFQADYSSKGLEKIVKDLFKDKNLKDLHNCPNFGKLNKNLMVTSFDLSPETLASGNKNYRAKLFHSEYMRDGNILLTDLCLMTSAGPTYFPIFGKKYIDGGVALNNPSMAAITFALNKNTDQRQEHLYPDGLNKGMGKEVADIWLLSLSSGTTNRNRIEEKEVGNGNWGKKQWIKYLPDLLTTTNMQTTDYFVEQIMDSKQYCRVNVLFDDDKLGGENAIRKAKKGIGLDNKDPDVLLAMHEYAKEIYQKNKKEILKIIDTER